MRGGVRAALGVAAACLFGCDAFAGPDGANARFLFFSGFDVWRNGGFLHGGVIWAPDGLDEDGFRLKGLLSNGVYRYRSDALLGTLVNGRELVAQLMPGWRFKWDVTEVSMFAGLDLESHRLQPDDPWSRLRGTDTGLRLALDVWSEPLHDAMLAANVSVSTINTSYSLRGAAGWRLFDLFYIGPEIGSFASGDYRQDRFGIHFTGLKALDTDWSAAAGWAHDSDHRAGPYIRFGLSTRR